MVELKVALMADCLVQTKAEKTVGMTVDKMAALLAGGLAESMVCKKVDEKAEM